MMTNGDPEGRIFLSYPHTNNGFFFWLTTVLFFFFKNKLPEVPEYAKMQFHMMTLLDVLDFLSQGKISNILIRCARIYIIDPQKMNSESNYCVDKPQSIEFIL